MLARANLTARKAVYKCESSMTQPVESVEWANTMKTKLTIEVKIDVAKVITALTSLVLTVAYISQYI
jgi:hypothetical protein